MKYRRFEPLGRDLSMLVLGTAGYEREPPDTSLEHRGRAWTLEDVEPPAEFRVYRATATAHYILGSIDRLVAVNLLNR